MTGTRIALAAACTLCVARAAFASEPLEVTRAPDASECPGQAEVRAAVTARLGRDPFVGAAPPRLQVEFSREGETFVALVRSASGERRLRSDAPTCGSLGEAAALAIVLFVRTDETAPAPPPPPEPPPAETAIIREQAGRPESPPPRSAVFVGAAALLGVLPQVAPAPMIALRTRFAPRALASAAILYAPAQRTPDGTYGFSLAAAQLGACWEAVAASAVSAGPCAHALVGDMAVSSIDPAAASPGDKLYLAGMAGARASFRVVGPLALDLGADAVVPFGRWRVVTACGTVPYDPARIGFSGSVAVGASFL